jgi:DNA-binding transcriptional MerR regulator
MKRRGNRRYYQHHEVLLVRRIRELLYEQGFTISGARNQLSDHSGSHPSASKPVMTVQEATSDAVAWGGPDLTEMALQHPQAAAELRAALVSIRDLLG